MTLVLLIIALVLLIALGRLYPVTDDEEATSEPPPVHGGRCERDGAARGPPCKWPKRRARDRDFPVVVWSDRCTSACPLRGC